MAPTRHLRGFAFWTAGVVYATALGAASLLAAPQTTPRSSGSVQPALAPSHSGQDIFRATCATCHGIDGKGSPKNVVGFEKELPDFTDCSFATAEADADWHAVVHEGGRIRGLDHHMPAFGEALSKADIASVVTYVRSFCTDRAWPRGDLNFPRAFFTEKAFPESEAVFTTGITTRPAKAIEEAFEYERRLGSRSQFTLEVPVAFESGGAGAPWVRGIGDVEMAFKRTVFSNVRTGTILAPAIVLTFPTGSTANGLGEGVVIYEPALLFDQRLPGTSFLQTHIGLEFPSDRTKVERSAYVRAALGKTFAAGAGFGRLWTPQVEVLWAREFGAASVWDVVPQLQISLSKLQHIRTAVGLRVPVTDRANRHAQFLTYLLWDWADGGFFEFWK